MEIKLKLPIEITPTENDGYVITDSQDSEFFFYKNNESGELVYDGCCVGVENKDIVLNHLSNEERKTQPINMKKVLNFGETIEALTDSQESYIVLISSFIDNEIVQFHIRAENAYEALKKATLEFEGGGIYNAHLVAIQSNNDFPSTFEELTSWLKKYKYSSYVFELHSFKKTIKNK